MVGAGVGGERGSHNPFVWECFGQWYRSPVSLM